ncbi:MAG: AmmeMemoRadiSam system protein A, partial [Pirellulales bacterium]
MPVTDGPSKSSDAPRQFVPDLSESQRRAILRSASELVTSAVFGRETEISDASLDGAARLPVMGCFLTIQRAGRLRACCGSIGRSTPLRDALIEAAVTTATRDIRMPRISPRELGRLDLTVALLHSVRPVEARGESRRAEVVVGRDGLQIARGPTRGLLLPSVATEHDLDVEHFLQQVCLKAGLSPTAWKADDTELATFEAVTMSGPLDDEVVASTGEPPPALLGPEDLRRLGIAALRLDFR